MKQALGVIATAALVALASSPTLASERAKANTAGKVRPASQATPAQAQPATPPGDTFVHRGLQGWANGMNRAARAMKLDKDPLEGRLPGAKRPPAHNPGRDPFDNDPLR